MAFSDFQNIEQVISQYPLEIRSGKFIPDVELELPDLFIENLNFSLESSRDRHVRCRFRTSQWQARTYGQASANLSSKISCITNGVCVIC